MHKYLTNFVTTRVLGGTQEEEKEEEVEEEEIVVVLVQSGILRQYVTPSSLD